MLSIYCKCTVGIRDILKPAMHQVVSTMSFSGLLHQVQLTMRGKDRLEWDRHGMYQYRKGKHLLEG